MEFFFPDSQDQINPHYDFIADEYPPLRVRQRDDLYAHEVLGHDTYDGMLVSKAIVEGARGGGKYTLAQRQRIYRLGAHRFFRAERAGRRLTIMGDCGAFTYVDEEFPPYSVREVADFYQGLNFDRGVSVDHIAFGYLTPAKRKSGAEPEPEWVRRRDLTLDLADAFLREVDKRGRPFEPVGVAHGWDPASYQASVVSLQDLGYDRIAIGGLVPRKTSDLLEVVQAVGAVRQSGVRFHLLGVTRMELLDQFVENGVTSFDSTSPFRQAFMDDQDNFHTLDGNFIALRIPQPDGNAALKKRVRSGELRQESVIALERACLHALREFDRGRASIDEVLAALREYEELHDTKGTDRTSLYRATLEAAPWKKCPCAVCSDGGVEVIIFRGTERNKRRGFHNLAVFGWRLDRLGPAARPPARSIDESEGPL